MILKYTWHGAMLEANHLSRSTGRRHKVRKTVPPGALLHWWVVEPVEAARRDGPDVIGALIRLYKRTPGRRADFTLVGPA